MVLQRNVDHLVEAGPATLNSGAVAGVQVSPVITRIYSPPATPGQSESLPHATEPVIKVNGHEPEFATDSWCRGVPGTTLCCGCGVTRA
jgi:hypothetical protein